MEDVDVHDPSLQQQLRRRLYVEAQRRDRDNCQCANCHAESPSWALLILNKFHETILAGLVCYPCGQAFKKHGDKSVGYLKNTKHEFWTPTQVQILEETGNCAMNFVFEGYWTLDDGRPHRERASDKEREDFICKKYNARKFYHSGNRSKQVEKMLKDKQKKASALNASASDTKSVLVNAAEWRKAGMVISKAASERVGSWGNTSRPSLSRQQSTSVKSTFSNSAEQQRPSLTRRPSLSRRKSSGNVGSSRHRSVSRSPERGEERLKISRRPSISRRKSTSTGLTRSSSRSPEAPTRRPTRQPSRQEQDQATRRPSLSRRKSTRDGSADEPRPARRPSLSRRQSSNNGRQQPTQSSSRTSRRSNDHRRSLSDSDASGWSTEFLNTSEKENDDKKCIRSLSDSNSSLDFPSSQQDKSKCTASEWTANFSSERKDETPKELPQRGMTRQRSLSDSDASGWSMDFIVSDDENETKTSNEKKNERPRMTRRPSDTSRRNNNNQRSLPEYDASSWSADFSTDKKDQKSGNRPNRRPSMSRTKSSASRQRSLSDSDASGWSTDFLKDDAGPQERNSRERRVPARKMSDSSGFSLISRVSMHSNSIVASDSDEDEDDVDANKWNMTSTMDGWNPFAESNRNMVEPQAEKQAKASKADSMEHNSNALRHMLESAPKKAPSAAASVGGNSAALRRKLRNQGSVGGRLDCSLGRGLDLESAESQDDQTVATAPCAPGRRRMKRQASMERITKKIQPAAALRRQGARCQELGLSRSRSLSLDDEDLAKVQKERSESSAQERSRLALRTTRSSSVDHKRRDKTSRDDSNLCRDSDRRSRSRSKHRSSDDGASSCRVESSRGSRSRSSDRRSKSRDRSRSSSSSSTSRGNASGIRKAGRKSDHQKRRSEHESDDGHTAATAESSESQTNE